MLLKRNKRGGRRNRKEKDGFVHQRVMRGFPPEIKSKPLINRVLRYRCGTAFTDKNFSMQSLWGHMLWVTNASTAAFSVVDAIMLTRVVMYSVPSANFGGSANEISFRWANLGSFENTITSRGTLTDPAKIVAVPQPNSLVKRAFDASDSDLSTTIAIINMPAESIIDFHVTYTLLDGAGTSVTLSGNATFTGLAPVSISLGTLIPDGTTNTVTTTTL